MPRKPSPLNEENARFLLRTFRALPSALQIGLVVVALIGAGLYFGGAFKARGPGEPGTPAGPTATVPAGDYLFCFWNVENLFDDRDDGRNSTDEPYDNWFSKDAASRQLKYDHLAERIVAMNGGRGPDVLGCCEVESVRAAELLRDALNARLPPDAPRYTRVAMVELKGNAGRFIAPCLITRLEIDAAATKLAGTRNLRVLETRLTANGHALTLVVSHWRSQLKQGADDGSASRMNYAKTIYGILENRTRADPAADFLVCGDFNDPPDAPSVVDGLRMTADRTLVTAMDANPRLLGLMCGKPVDRFSTIYYEQEKRPQIFDQIGVSAGMLDVAGWGCDPDSVRTVTDGLIRPAIRGEPVRRPWVFGNQGNKLARGYSDHFPVTVTLKVAGPAQP